MMWPIILQEGTRPASQRISAPATESYPRSVDGTTVEQIIDAYEELRVELDRTPTVPRVAERLYISESTLRRRMRKLGMKGWPPTRPTGS